METIKARTLRLSSSLRSRTAEESLKFAAAIAMSRGISRVVDTTWLDRIGIPVFASIRPDAAVGSLCVHAGKGFTPDEAKIGAFMEGIEFSFAEPGRSVVNWSMAKPLDIPKSFGGNILLPDFGPQFGRRISDADDTAVVEGDELLSRKCKVLVPAELVFHPFHENTGVRLYGTTTNGLASGSTLLEATVHALAEVIERDIRSFEIVDDCSILIDVENAPPQVKAISARIEDTGLRCYLRYSPNAFGLPYFSAYILEPAETNPIAVAAGFGLHPIAEIAAVRALAEAAQSRLTHIHGGRDDTIQRATLALNVRHDVELESVRCLRGMAAESTRTIRFSDVPTFDQNVSSLEEALDCLFEALGRVPLRHVVRVTFTEPSYPFQ